MKQSPEKNQPKNPKFKKPTRETVLFTIFVIAWAALAMIAAQYIVAFPMVWILGQSAGEPFWTLVYYILEYGLALALIILIPPRLWQLMRQKNAQHRQVAGKQSVKPEKASSKAVTTSPATIESKGENPLTTTPSELGFSTGPTFVDIGLAPVAYIVYLFSAQILSSIMSLFSWFNIDQAQDVGFSYYMSSSDRFFAMLAIVFIAPIAEEIIMRGWLYGKLRSRLSIIISMLLVSILFGALHGQWNVAVVTFALSIILCGLREITGTIWSGILLHMLVNSIAFYQIYVVGL